MKEMSVTRSWCLRRRTTSMYWYLSFLRAPPVSLVTSSSGTLSVNITPQVANDLRTELKETPTSIDYIWQRISPSVQDPLKAIKLTTYHPPASTYKQLSVPLPQRAKAGEKWRLGLVESGSPHTTELESLAGSSVGVLSVWSEAVEILRGSSKPSSAKNAAGGKQGRITRVWSLPGNEEELVIVEQTSFDLDKKLWDSGLALSALFSTWLYPAPPDAALATSDERWTKEVVSRLVPSETRPHCRHLEIGTGTGVVTIALAALLSSYLRANKTFRPEYEDPSSSPERSVSILCTDLPSAIPLIEENIELNSKLWSSDEASVIAKSTVLDWDEPIPESARSGPVDLIIAADVTYNTAAFPALLSTLVDLLKPDQSGAGPLLVLAYKERDPAERDLWVMMQEKGIWTVNIGGVLGADTGTGETEIWVAGMTPQLVATERYQKMMVTASDCQKSIRAHFQTIVNMASVLSASLFRLPAFMPHALSLQPLLDLLPPILWAVPKHRTTHSRKSMRSANKGLKNKTNINACSACGTPKLAHHVCPVCYSQISRRWKAESRPTLGGVEGGGAPSV